MTRLRPLLSCALPLVLGWAAWSPSAPSAAPTVPGALAQDEGEESPLHAAMETINGGLRELRALVGGEDRAGTLATLDRVQQAALTAKAQAPVSLEVVPAEQRDAFLADYRNELLTLVERLIAVERAVLTGDREGARTILEEQVLTMKKDAHNRFKRPGGWTPN
jgi:hypothetical protein